MTEWKEYKLGEIVQSISDTYKFVDNEKVVFLNTSDILNGKFLNDCLVSAATLPGQAKKKIQKGDILFSEIRPANKRFAIVDFESSNYVVSTKLMVLRCNEQIYNKFLYIYLTSYEVLEYLQMIAEDRSGTFPQITFDNIANMSISLPPLPEQIRIASILSSLDDKIDLLHRENKTLEAMAETLFRQWFIEEAKEDWEEGTIADLAEFNPTRKLVKGSIAPFLEMSNLSTSTYAPTYWYDRAYNSGTKFENGDTLLARITPCLENGKTAYVDFLCDNQVGWGSTEFIVMHSKLGLHPFFTYVIAKYQDFRDFAESCMSGSSGRQRVDVDNLRKYPMAIPDKVTVELFNDRIENMVSKMHNNNKQIQNLIQQRDSLLPKLMSGEVKI